MEKLALTIEEAGEAVGLSRTEIYRAIARRELVAMKFGRLTRIAREDLEAFVAAKRRESQLAAAV